MIEFKQLESDPPSDIEVTTDDSQAELVQMEDAFKAAGVEDDFLAAMHLSQAHMEDGKVTFVIPGEEADEVAEFFEVEGMPQLQQYLDELNKKAGMEALADAEN